jgi:hypothetical protein
MFDAKAHGEARVRADPVQRIVKPFSFYFLLSDSIFSRIQLAVVDVD